MAKPNAMTAEWPECEGGRLDHLRRRLKAFFRRGGASISDAEDLAQDVFVRLSSSAGCRGEPSEAYVFTIARNLQRDSVRRTQVRHKHGFPADQDIYPLMHQGSDGLDAERVLISKQNADRLVEGMAELPARMLEIFLLYRLEGMSQREISARLGLSLSAVEKNLAKAMSHLVQKMGWEK